MTTYTSIHELEKPQIGGDQGVWGAMLHRNQEKIDKKLSGAVSISLATDVSLTTNQGGSPENFDNRILVFAGSVITDRTVTLPAGKPGNFIVDLENVTFGTSGAVIIKHSGETGVTVTSATTNKNFEVYTNGSSVKALATLATSWIIDEIKMYAPAGGYSAAALPTGWFVCDGTNGTIDLRDKFVRGASNYSTWATSNTGGANTDSIAAQNVSIGGTTTSTTLTNGHIPKHHHKLFASQQTTNTQGLNLGPSQFCAEWGESSGDHEYSIIGTATSAGVGKSSMQVEAGTSPTKLALPWSDVVSVAGATVSTVPEYQAVVYIQYKG
jgi:microcystin-dependent protein